MEQQVKQRRIRVVLIVVAALVVIGVLTVAFWPWLRPWFPHPRLIEAWIRYLTVDLDVGRWGPVVTLLLVAIIELVWVLILGRRSGAFERQWKRAERAHGHELEVLQQEISLLKEERRSLRAELALREDLIREEKARLWAQFDDLQRASGLLRSDGTSRWETGVAVLLSPTALSEIPEMAADVRGEWRQIISQLERIEMIASVTTQRGQNAMEMQQRADELLRLGAACYYLGQYERAMAHYSRAIDLAPNVPEAYINRGVVNQALSRYQPALQDMDRALKAGENAWAYLYRGLIREEQGDRKRAMEDYTRALRVNPDFVDAYYRRGRLYGVMGEHDKSFQDQSRAVSLSAHNALALTARGVARAALGDTQWALSDLDQACALAPKLPDAFFQRGKVRLDLDMYDEALEDFRHVIELAPDMAPAYVARGDTYAAVEEYWQAVADYDRAVELQPKNAVIYYARGRARLALREYRRAIEDFDRALELEPAMAAGLANRGSAYEKIGEYEQAIRDLDRAIALNPDLAIAYYNRGLAYGSMGEYDRASRDLNRAVELDPALASQEHGATRARA